MHDLDEFLTTTVARLKTADTAIHNGDPEPRKSSTWAHEDPVTLFGAAFTGKGWDEVSAVFDRLGRRFSNCESFEIEVVAAGVSDSLAYIVAIERTQASISGEPQSYALRVTQIFRFEGGEWRVVHRHADPLESPPENLVTGLRG